VLFGMSLPYTSRITQPPLIARAVLDVYSKSRNRKFLIDVFPRLQLYHKWLEDRREVNGVLKVVDSNESGEDNSVLWDDELTIPLHKTYLRWLTTYVPFFPQKAAIKSVKATAIYADALHCMAEMAMVLGMKQYSNHYKEKSEAVAAAMTAVFKQKDGLYYSRTNKDKPIPYKTNSLFAPMFAGVLSKAEAKKLVGEHLLNEKEFWTPFPIPTVAISEPKFSAKGYWRGPMWININWMLHRALLRYGFKAVAAELLEKNIAAVRKSGFREYYNPLTGEGLGAKQFGWSTLIMDMMLKN
ncbi:MAG: trehalase family glycosidase, partial [Nanoarchaeota archaeon]